MTDIHDIDEWVARQARAISGPRTHLQDPEALIQFGLHIAHTLIVAYAPAAYTAATMPEYRDTPDGAVAAYAPERDGPFRCDHCRYSRGERGALQCIKPEMVTESKILRGLPRHATSAPVEDGACCDFQKPSVNAHA